MLLILFCFSLFFLIGAFLPNATHILTQNPLFGYLVYQIHFVISHLLLVVGIFFLLSLLFFRQHFTKQISIVENYFSAFQQTLLAFFLSIFIAYIALYFIAFLNLNIFSVLISLNPKSVGVESDSKIVVAWLHNQGSLQNLMITTDDQASILSAITSVPTGTGNFYGSNILLSVPSFFVIPIKKPDAAFVKVDNTLILIKADTKKLQAVAPYVGYQLIQNYFTAQKIKTYPHVTVLGPDKYLSYREADAKKKLEKVDKQLVTISEKVSSLSAQITNNTDNIATTEALIKTQKQNQYTEYSQCLINKNPVNLCQDLKNRWDEKIQKSQEANATYTAQIKADQDLLTGYAYYDNFFRTQRTAIEQQTQKVPNEAGVFLPKDSIRLVMTGADRVALGAYAETLIHEYLHYASFKSDTKKFESTFFEEGLTEFFARRVVENGLHVETNFAYPVQVKIITAMTNLLTEDELAQIYFAKDEDGLEKAIDRVYGDGFYQSNYLQFESLQYLSDPKEMLKTANQIMQKIGGEKLTEKDLYSAPTSGD